MRIVVLIKQVPDLVEELEIGEDGKSLDQDVVKYVLNEFDDQALEEALQLKEEQGGEVVVYALAYGDVDQALCTCLAKGADRAVKLVGEWEGSPDSHTTARALAAVLESGRFDLILTGVQAVDDLDGQVGPLLATYLGLPHVSVATHLAPAGGALTVHQEYGGGMMARFVVQMPAVLGIQAARATPRYASVSKVRQLMRGAQLEEVSPGDVSSGSGLIVERLYRPVLAAQAEMLGEDPEEVAEAIARILQERGLVRA